MTLSPNSFVKRQKDGAELPLLCDHPIPHHYLYSLGNVTGMELHGFSDTSELAYSTVVYPKSTNADGAVHTGIVKAKTKVFPS